MTERRAEALALSKGQEPTASAVERVARRVGMEDAAWAFTQWELRRRGEAKFGMASEMLFVREALEQATHERVAAWRAGRFPSGELVADLTCGIGGDLIALARRGPAVGYELDPERAACARHNLEVHGLRAPVREKDSLRVPWEWRYAMADPARRVEGRRMLDPDSFSPDPAAVAERMRELELGAIKLSPMLDDEYLESFGGGLEFVSHRGECVEAVVWLGRRANPGRRAVQVESAEELEAGEPPFAMHEPQAFVFEADPAAIRAHALGSLCERYDLAALGESNGYLTGPEDAESPWLRSYRRIWFGAFHGKAVRQALADLDLRLEAVKTRGVKLDPAALKKQLRHDGRTPVALMLYPEGPKVRALLAASVRPGTGR